MKYISAMLALCEENPLLTCSTPYKEAFIQIFYVTFEVFPNKLRNETIELLAVW